MFSNKIGTIMQVQCWRVLIPTLNKNELHLFIHLSDRRGGDKITFLVVLESVLYLFFGASK